MPRNRPVGKRYSLWYSEELFNYFKLIAAGKTTVKELMKATGKAESTIAEQMGYLIKSKMIDFKREGKEYHYFINVEKFNAVLHIFLMLKNMPNELWSPWLHDLPEIEADLFTKGLWSAEKDAKNFSEFFLLGTLWYLLNRDLNTKILKPLNKG